MVDWPGRGPKALIVDIKGGFRMAVGGEGALPGKITLGGEGGRVPGMGKWTGASGAAVVLGQIGLAFWWEESPSNIGA